MSSSVLSPHAWIALLPTSFLARWSGVAPKHLDQPIQPGWIVGSTINVTELNSASPDTEAAILQKSSYGRQLGRISDALEILIEERAKAGGTPDDALTTFSDMKADIDRVKAEAATSRTTQLRRDLETLRHENPGQYERLRTELLGVLDADHASGNGHPKQP